MGPKGLGTLRLFLIDATAFFQISMTTPKNGENAASNAIASTQRRCLRRRRCVCFFCVFCRLMTSTTVRWLIFRGKRSMSNHSLRREISVGDKIASRCGAPRPPMTDVGTETAFRLDHRKHFRKVNISWGQRSVDAIFTCVDLHDIVLVSRSINMLSVTDFVPKGIISGVRVQAGLHLDMLDADRSPNMQSAFLPELHRWISKMTARHLHACPPGDLLITMVHCDPFLPYPAYFRGDEIWQFSPYRGLNAIKPRFDRYSCGFFMSADFPWCVSLCLCSIFSNVSLRCRDIPPQSQSRRSCKKSALV